MRYKTLAAVLAGSFLLVGCSDDTSSKKDQGGPRQDVAPQTDGTSTDREGGAGDGSHNTQDRAVNPVCDPVCQQESHLLCVTDPADGDCIQCSEDAHCAAMPDADGPRCDVSSKRCVECLVSDDCANHPSGSVCDGTTCACNSNSDCSGTERFGPVCVQLHARGRCGCETDDVCSGTTLGSKCFADFNHKCVCFEAADCAGNGDKTACHLAYYYSDYGLCAAPCTSDAHCRLHRMERCNVNTGVCIECTQDADCGGVERGFKCLTGKCSCESNADCPRGSECEDFMGIVQCYSQT